MIVCRLALGSDRLSVLQAVSELSHALPYISKVVRTLQYIIEECREE